jgi:hypothetical protein
MFSTVGKFRYLIPFTLFFALSRAVKAFKWALELKAPYVKAIVAGTIDSLRGRMGRCPKDF